MKRKSGEKKLPIQNMVREQKLVKMFGLKLSRGRLGVDAYDESGNPFELKSTTVSGVGTGRDVSLEMLEAWKRRYWLIGVGRNLRSGFVFDEIYFLSPEMIEGRLNEIEDKIRPDLELRDRAVALLESTFPSEELERLYYLISRGSTLNNPKISMRYIRNNGVRIDDNYRGKLRELIKKHPLPT